MFSKRLFNGNDSEFYYDCDFEEHLYYTDRDVFKFTFIHSIRTLLNLSNLLRVMANSGDFKPKSLLAYGPVFFFIIDIFLKWCNNIKLHKLYIRTTINHIKHVLHK